VEPALGALRMAILELLPSFSNSTPHAELLARAGGDAAGPFSSAERDRPTSPAPCAPPARARAPVQRPWSAPAGMPREASSGTRSCASRFVSHCVIERLKHITRCVGLSRSLHASTVWPWRAFSQGKPPRAGNFNHVGRAPAALTVVRRRRGGARLRSRTSTTPDSSSIASCPGCLQRALLEKARSSVPAGAAEVPRTSPAEPGRVLHDPVRGLKQQWSATSRKAGRTR